MRSENLRGPLRLDVRDDVWPVADVQYAFSANTAHIMSWPEVELMFAGVARALAPKGVFCLYGPFNRDGQFTSESNRAFDESLRAQDPKMGVRNDRDLMDLAARLRSHLRGGLLDAREESAARLDKVSGSARGRSVTNHFTLLPARNNQVSTTVSGLRDMLSMPCSTSHRARSG